MLYEKADIKKGLFFTLDCSVPTLLSPRRAPPNAPPKKYGEEPSPFKQIAERLEEARKRLDEIREGVRRARRQGP